MRPQFASLIAGLAIAAAAHGAVIVNGTSQLRNQPDGSARPPLYGLRLDELYNATAGHDIFTFDFDHAMSNMRMEVTATSIRIYGVTMGGRVTGGASAADVYNGLHTVDFTYSIGVANKPGDDDRWVKYGAPDVQDSGAIMTPLGHTIALRDESNGSYQFRLGDEDNDAGHRGFPVISGWGWLNHGPVGSPHVDSSDWIFTASLIPNPGALALMGLGGLVAARRRS
jgi:MYXO-CTERM domain-containing protein